PARLDHENRGSQEPRLGEETKEREQKQAGGRGAGNRRASIVARGGTGERGTERGAQKGLARIAGAGARVGRPPFRGWTLAGRDRHGVLHHPAGGCPALEEGVGQLALATDARGV